MKCLQFFFCKSRSKLAKKRFSRGCTGYLFSCKSEGCTSLKLRLELDSAFLAKIYVLEPSLEPKIMASSRASSLNLSPRAESSRAADLHLRAESTSSSRGSSRVELEPKFQARAALCVTVFLINKIWGNAYCIFYAFK